MPHAAIDEAYTEIAQVVEGVWYFAQQVTDLHGDDWRSTTEFDRLRRQLGRLRRMAPCIYDAVIAQIQHEDHPHVPTHLRDAHGD